MPFNLDTVQSQFVDTDLAEDAKARGFLPGHIVDDRACRLPNLADKVQLVPSSQWKAQADAIAAAGGGSTQLVTHIKNQRSEGSCVGNAETQTDEILQAKQFGRENVVELSAISAYKQIGRSPSSGANIGDAIDCHLETGILPLDTPANRTRFGNHVMPATGFRTPWPDGWKETAKNFRAHEYLVIQSVEEMFTALLNQIPVVVGRSGHSIVYCDLVYKGNDPCVIYCNSWGEWGFGAGSFTYGFGLDTMRSIRSSSNWAYGVRSVVVPSFRVPPTV